MVVKFVKYLRVIQIYYSNMVSMVNGLTPAMDELHKHVSGRYMMAVSILNAKRLAIYCNILLQTILILTLVFGMNRNAQEQ